MRALLRTSSDVAQRQRETAGVAKRSGYRYANFYYSVILPSTHTQYARYLAGLLRVVDLVSDDGGGGRGLEAGEGLELEGRVDVGHGSGRDLRVLPAEEVAAATARRVVGRVEVHVRDGAERLGNRK